ncbi:Thioredoxin-like protein CXXS1 [Bienertia sinuspersici]
MDEVLGLAKRLGVKAMPTFLMLKDGVVVDMLVGANPQEVWKRAATFVQPSPIVHIC